MGIRVALASTDGKVVNHHFGHAERFHIAEIIEDGYTFIESRDTIAACQQWGHSGSTFDDIAALLADCRGVFASRVGLGAAGYMIDKGIRIFEAPVLIEDVLRHVIEKRLFQEVGTTGAGREGPEHEPYVSGISSGSSLLRHGAEG